MLSVFTPLQWKPKTHEEKSSKDKSIPDCLHMESLTGELGTAVRRNHPYHPQNSSAPRRTIFHIPNNILSKISLTLGSVHVVTLRKITLCFSGVAGGSILQEHHLLRKILHYSTDRIAAETCTGTAQVTTMCTVIYPEQFTQRSQKKCVLLCATWNYPVVKPG